MSELRVRGAKVNGASTVPKNTHTTASFGTVWDSDGYFNASASTEVLTIPRPKRRGRYQIRVAVRWMNPWGITGDPPPSYDEFVTMNYYTYITVNGDLLGNEARATASPVLGASGTTQYFATDENLGFGDSVGVRLWQSVGDDVQAFVFLEIRRVGPRVAAPASVMPVPSDPLSDTG